MKRASLVTCGRVVALALVALFGGAAGCVPVNQQLQTSSYTLSHPDYWNVKKTAARDGEPTVVVIPQYGSAVIDQGTGAMAAKGENYDAVTADVEVRLYSWPDPGSGDPTQEVGKRLAADRELSLAGSYVIPDNPPECGALPRKYTMFGQAETPVDLVKAPGYRTIVVGGRANGKLIGAVARVEYEPDHQRNCHNVSNMRVQLQNLLDGLAPTGGAAPQPRP